MYLRWFLKTHLLRLLSVLLAETLSPGVYGEDGKEKLEVEVRRRVRVGIALWSLGDNFGQVY